MKILHLILETFDLRDPDIHHPIFKAVTPPTFLLFGHTWGEWASVLACITSVLFITEWVYKRLYRPFAAKHGWWTLPYTPSEKAALKE